MAELSPTATSPCCTTEQQAACCEPEDKADCCTPQSDSCGCGAGETADPLTVREVVRDRYAAAARAASGEAPRPHAAAGLASPTSKAREVFGASLYNQHDAEASSGAVAASLGCGVPTAVADLREGEIVLDLGSGAGADVLISARRVGPTGRVIGLDMTDEMLELARANAAQAGVKNVEFVKGYIEEMPLDDETRRRRHLQLRDQPLRRQAPRDRRSGPCPTAGAAASPSRTSSPTRTWTTRRAPTWRPGRDAWPAPSPSASFARRSRTPVSRRSRSRRPTASTSTRPRRSSGPQAARRNERRRVLPRQAARSPNAAWTTRHSGPQLSRSRCRRTGHLARGVLVVDRCPEHGQRGVGGVAEAL